MPQMATHHVVGIDEMKELIRQELLDYMRDHSWITGFREAKDGFLIDVNSNPAIAISVKRVEPTEVSRAD
jgi:hypothetical protein